MLCQNRGRARQAAAIVLFFCLVFLPGPGRATDGPWRELEPGMALASFEPPVDSFPAPVITVLRLDPELVEFVLLNASQTGQSRSLGDWAEQYGLAAAINASMYLPDGRTSTGYMRNGEHENNARIVNNFGAFFLAGRKDRSAGTDLPAAVLLDRHHDAWEERLEDYGIVIQNYRMIGADGRMLWTPGGPAYAVAAVGADNEGRILFIHCREPMTGAEFGSLLQELPLDLRMVMYVEGGSQAGLLVRAGDVDQVWMGRHMADFLTSGNKNTLLPNVLGVRARSGPVVETP